MPPPTVLAGDVGATKTVLALCEGEPPRGTASLRETSCFASADFPDLESLLARFRREEGSGAEMIDAAAFGVAGPVLDRRASGVNFPWTVEEESLRRALRCERVRVLNDLEAMAYGTLAVGPADLLTLQEGRARRGNRAVIAAGTGLGQAFLLREASRYRPCAGEGGHADFAPRNDLEWGLLKYLLGRYPRVSWERVVSGPGLHHIFLYLTEVLGRPVSGDAARRLAAGEDPNAVIGEAGSTGVDPTGVDPTCEEAVEMFLSLYGAQAGNLALTVMATGGVFVGGGIVARMLPKIASSDSFLAAFRAKGRYEGILREIPVHVLRNPNTGLLGAMRVAWELLQDERRK